jgi:hypothetical protein
MRRSGASSTATGTSAVRAVAANPSGGRTMESKWLIHTERWSPAGPSSTESAVGSRVVRPYSPRPVLATSPPSCRATSWAP